MKTIFERILGNSPDRRFPVRFSEIRFIFPVIVQDLSYTLRGVHGLEFGLPAIARCGLGWFGIVEIRVVSSDLVTLPSQKCPER